VNAFSKIPSARERVYLVIGKLLITALKGKNDSTNLFAEPQAEGKFYILPKGTVDFWKNMRFQLYKHSTTHQLMFTGPGGKMIPDVQIDDDIPNHTEFRNNALTVVRFLTTKIADINIIT
jgi:hypothetical protein